MAKTIGTADRKILHPHCGKEVATVKGGVPHVQCTRRGCKEHVRLDGFGEISPIRKAIDLILSGKVSPADVIALGDPLADRQIEGLFVVGAKELDKLFRIDPKGNPLNLQEGWIPEPPVIEERTDSWIRSCIWRDDPDWNSRAALVLCPPAVGDIPTSLVGQNKLLGVAHDGIPAGIVRQDVFWSKWLVAPNYDWANKPAVAEWHWVLVYEHPVWTTRKNWSAQQKVAQEKGMPISTATQDVWVLNMVRAYHEVSLRLSTWSRTSTVCDGGPLDVGSDSGGVYVFQCWAPSSADGNVGLSVQGVPLDFVP